MANITPNRTRKSALLVIDIQESFRHMPDWVEDDLPAFQKAVVRLENAARERGIPVIHIFHSGRAGPFLKESGFVRPLEWLPGLPDAVFEKHTHNAFTDTGLDLWLRRHDVEHLVISGIRTEQCCETTTRVAADLGYEVDFVTDATLTFPMTHASTGFVFSAAEIKIRTELVLDGRFARISTVDESIGGWASGAA